MPSNESPRLGQQFATERTAFFAKADVDSDILERGGHCEPECLPRFTQEEGRRIGVARQIKGVGSGGG